MSSLIFFIFFWLTAALNLQCLMSSKQNHSATLLGLLRCVPVSCCKLIIICKPSVTPSPTAVFSFLHRTASFNALANFIYFIFSSPSYVYIEDCQPNNGSLESALLINLIIILQWCFVRLISHTIRNSFKMCLYSSVLTSNTRWANCFTKSKYTPLCRSFALVIRNCIKDIYNFCLTITFHPSCYQNLQLCFLTIIWYL